MPSNAAVMVIQARTFQRTYQREKGYGLALQHNSTFLPNEAMMSKLQRFLSGTLVGGATILMAHAFLPQPLLARGDFCDTDENGDTYCCNVEDGEITDCEKVE